MDKATDYYEVLLVHPEAPLEIIRSSYRTLMQRLRAHPDLGGDTEHAALINAAYAVLSDPEKRAAYDRTRRPARAAPRTAAARGPGPEAEHAAREPRGHCLFCLTPHALSATLHADDLCAECESPLFPAERHRLQSSGQRMLGRINQNRPVFCYTRWPQAEGIPARMCDLSLNGMQIATPFAAEPESLLKLESEQLKALARVAYCRIRNDGGWLLGVEFVTLVFRRASGNFVSAHA